MSQAINQLIDQINDQKKARDQLLVGQSIIFRVAVWIGVGMIVHIKVNIMKRSSRFSFSFFDEIIRRSFQVRAEAESKHTIHVESMNHLAGFHQERPFSAIA